ETFTLVHVVISLIAIVSGIIVLFGMFGGHRMSGMTALFLLTTILTSVTGFLFPISGFTPAIGFGIISLVLLALSVLGLYVFHLAGAWRWIYVVTAVIALYLNVFVLVFQSFLKLSFLKSLAPTASEPPFQITQGVVLVLFIIAAIVAVRGFHPRPAAT